MTTGDTPPHQVAGGGAVHQEGGPPPPLSRQELDAVGHAVPFAGQNAVDVGQVQISVADEHGGGGQIAADGLLHVAGLVDGAHEHRGVHLALLDGLDVLGLLPAVHAGVVDQAGVPLLGQRPLEIEDAVRMVGGADVGDEDADHPRGLRDKAARGLVGRVVILLQQGHDALSGGLLYVGPVVDDPRNGAGRYIRNFSDIINRNFPPHKDTPDTIIFVSPQEKTEGRHAARHRGAGLNTTTFYIFFIRMSRRAAGAWI